MPRSLASGQFESELEGSHGWGHVEFGFFVGMEAVCSSSHLLRGAC